MAGVTLDAQNWKLTTAITRQAAEDLQLAQGDQVTALFKATEVCVKKRDVDLRSELHDALSA